MYGTIARLRIRPGMEAQFREFAKQESVKIPGLVAQYVYQMDADPEEFYLVVLFTSKEAYVANAASPEQHARYQEYITLLAAEPEWHDGTIIFADPIPH